MVIVKTMDMWPRKKAEMMAYYLRIHNTLKVSWHRG